MDIMRYLIRIIFIQVPLVYVIPVDSILEKLSLVQAGDTGTIPFETIARNQADRDALCDKFYPGGRSDQFGSWNWRRNQAVAYERVDHGLVSGHIGPFAKMY